jgi:hypothetical protein
VTTHEIAAAFNNGMEFLARLAGIGFVRGRTGGTRCCGDEALQTTRFRLAISGLPHLELQQEFELIGDVRGSGLFLG